MKYIVIRSHKSDYPNPISLKKGEKVKVYHTYVGEEDWKNWVFCEDEYGRKGWVPKQIIATKQGEIGIILEAYIAKELDVGIDEVLIKIRELNGWMWCEKIGTKEQGWVPKSNIKEINKHNHK
ncbi:SH3 domain-containing protein [Bacillus manliponensis]|uniref:SH3 domain-containing protein n=1 Tax=Bacillus manliponensis TaxID=574376 RepID=UPI0035189D77